MKRLVLLAGIALTLAACGNKTNTASADADSTRVYEVPDTLNTVEAVVRQVNAVFDYMDEVKQKLLADSSLDHSKFPSVDERFATKEWQQVMDDVSEIDRACECGGFFDFGDTGPLSPWTYDCYEGRVSADSIEAKLQPDGTAEVKFLVKDAVTVKGVPMRWLMRVEDGQWRVGDIFFEADNGMDLLDSMRDYVRHMKFVNGFDIHKYADQMVDRSEMFYYKSTDPIRLKDYAFVDIDGDGLPEVWVRGDEGQDYQGVYSLDGDSVTLLASSDVRSELEFYKGAVGFDGYYGDGLHRQGFTFLKDSRDAGSYFMEHKFNIFSEDQETIDLIYLKDGKSITEEEWKKAETLLGDTVHVAPAWYPIEQKPNLSDYAE